MFMFPTDVATEEQQKAMPVNEDNEEPVSEDLAMETESPNIEDLRAADAEKLNPEVKMSGASKSGKLSACFFEEHDPSGICTVCSNQQG